MIAHAPWYTVRMSDVITLFLLGAAAYVLFFRDDDEEPSGLEPLDIPRLGKGTGVTRATAQDIGDALGVDFDEVDIDEFRMGLQEEEEHEDITRGDWEMTAKIALAHLEEDPEYYSKLKRTFG